MNLVQFKVRFFDLYQTIRFPRNRLSVDLVELSGAPGASFIEFRHLPTPRRFSSEALLSRLVSRFRLHELGR